MTKPKLELLTSLMLSDFPSGSSVSFYDGKLFLVGDDANYILVLNELYQEVNKIQLFNFPMKRIPKSEKADLESSTIISLLNKAYLLALGSASLAHRTRGFLIPLQGLGQFTEFHFEEFVSRLKMYGVDEVNIEGATVIGDQIILSSRGNLTHPKNKIIITDKDFWKRQGEVNIVIKELEHTINSPSNKVLGVSGLCYLPSRDLLLVTFSSEITDNAYDDGTIGDSYIGWIEGITLKIKEASLVLKGMINLAEVGPEFNGEKIEGLCVESVLPEEMILHLVSDDDQGHSKLFKVSMS